MAARLATIPEALTIIFYRLLGVNDRLWALVRTRAPLNVRRSPEVLRACRRHTFVLQLDSKEANRPDPVYANSTKRLWHLGRLR